MSAASKSPPKCAEALSLPTVPEDAAQLQGIGRLEVPLPEGFFLGFSVSGLHDSGVFGFCFLLASAAVWGFGLGFCEGARRRRMPATRLRRSWASMQT